MPRTGTNIFKRKDGRWEGRYIKDHKGGKARYGYVYAHSYKEVNDKLKAAKEKNAQQVSVQEKAGTVASVSASWLKEASRNLKETTIIKYEDILRCYILPEFGDYELSEITNDQLVRFSDKLLSEGGTSKKGLSAAMVSEIITTMNSIRIHALRSNCTVTFTTECVNIKKEMVNIRVFTPEEQDRLVNWLMNHMNPTSLAIMVCLFTGLRIGEICALEWDNIDLEAGNIRICQTMQRIRVRDNPEKKTEVKILEPKSDRSIRTIPLPCNLRELLANYQKDNGFLMTGDDGKIVEPRTLQYRFKSILKKCGIADANFHTTRHTFATRCVERGFDVKCLSEILGHASVAITLNRYVHPSMELKSANMELLADLFPA